MSINKQLNCFVFFSLLTFCINAFAVIIKIRIIDNNRSEDVEWNIKVNSSYSSYSPTPDAIGDYEINQSWHSFANGSHQISANLQATRTSQSWGACCYSGVDKIDIPLKITFPQTLSHPSNIRIWTETRFGHFLIERIETMQEQEGNGFIISLYVHSFSRTKNIKKQGESRMTYFDLN